MPTRPVRDQVFDLNGNLISEEIGEVDVTVETNEATLKEQVQAALNTNRSFLALPSPTSTQVITQVRRLTQQTQALARLAVNLLDETD